MKTTSLRNAIAAIAALFTAAFALLFRTQDQNPKAYVVKSADGKTLTFYYDNLRDTRDGTVYGIGDT